MRAFPKLGWPEWASRLAPSRGGLRMAVISTPRSGNSWLRRMLATLYGLSPERGTELWAHDPEAFPWRRLPRRCVMQLHWRPEGPFLARLAEHDVRVVMVHRHPLDVLISVLQLARHTPETGMWLLGDSGDEASIRGVSPLSDAFLNYATGPRAAALLSVSTDWARTPGTLRVRYEDLVRDTVGELGWLAESLRPTPTAEVQLAVAACTMSRLRNPQNAPHFWQGKPGHWSRLLTAEAAERIAEAHPAAFREFGYECKPDPTLTGEQADAHWNSLVTTPRVAA